MALYLDSLFCPVVGNCPQMRTSVIVALTHHFRNDGISKTNVIKWMATLDCLYPKPESSASYVLSSVMVVESGGS